ncbi:MAG: acyltransferase [Prevotella sp.]|nr:acyltransferase [Prevotella sp.]
MNGNTFCKTEISKTIDFLRFPATILVVLLHAYTTLQMTSAMDMPLYSNVASCISLCFGEIGVPLFFTISGYLFFLSFSMCDYFRKIKTRTKSLLVPYLMWNTFFICVYFIIQQIPSLSPFFSGNNKKVIDYTCIDFIRAYWDCGNWNQGNGTPILQTYWYVRNLFILCLLSPFILFIVKRTRYIFVSIFIVLWILKTDSAFTLSSISFFSLGAYVAQNTNNIWLHVKKNLYPLAFAYIMTLFLDIMLKTNGIYPYGYYVHRMGIIIAIPLMFSLCYRLCKRFSFPELMVKSSFFIYSLHLPLMLAIRKISYRLISDEYEIMHIVLYLASVPIVILICLVIFQLLKKYTPTLLNTINGR